MTTTESDVDTTDIEGQPLEMHFENGELTIIVGGVDVSHMVNRASWFWMKGSAPRLSLDLSGISTLDMYQETASASFRRTVK